MLKKLSLYANVVFNLWIMLDILILIRNPFSSPEKRNKFFYVSLVILLIGFIVDQYTTYYGLYTDKDQTDYFLYILGKDPRLEATATRNLVVSATLERR